MLDIGEKDFRDPKVFWHEPTQRWVMVVAWPLPHRVRFYASKNLKQWTHLSDFGPAGASKEIWECPDLFPLAIGGKRERKWVLIVNTSGAPAGGSGCLRSWAPPNLFGPYQIGPHRLSSNLLPRHRSANRDSRSTRAASIHR